MKSKQRIYDYFFSETNSYRIAVFLVTTFLAYIIIEMNSMIKPEASYYFFGIGILLNYAVPYFLNKRKQKKDIIAKNTTNSNQKIDINRTDRLTYIKGERGLVVLTGESGTGKSYLLTQFKNENNNCKMESNNYFSGCNARYDVCDYEGYRYVVFDQFEQVLYNAKEQIIYLIEELIKKDNCLIIVSARIEYFGEINRVFTGLIRQVIYLNYSKEEIKRIHSALSKDFFGNNADNSVLLKRIKNDLEHQKITFIQLSFLTEIILSYGTEKAEEIFINNKCDYDLTIQKFLISCIKEFDYSGLSFQIMYLLCRDNKGNYKNTIQDFQNITLQKKDNIIKTLNFLMQWKLVSKVFASNNNHDDIMLDDSFEISHDYVQHLFDIICRNNIDADIRSNIDYYNDNIQQKRKELSNEKKRKITNVNRICSAYLCDDNDSEKNKPPVFANVLFFFCCLIILFINTISIVHYCGVDGGRLLWIDAISLNNTNEVLLKLALNNVMVWLSIFYVYHFYYHFLRIFKYVSHNMYIFVCCIVLIGSFGCFASLLLFDYWAIPLAVEVILIGSCELIIAFKMKKNERKSIRSLGIHTLPSGIMIAILGYCFHIYTDYNFWLGFPFYVLYGVFMILCIIGHINRRKMLSLCGNVIMKYN